MSTEEKDKSVKDEAAPPVDTADDHAAHHADEPMIAEADRPNVGVIAVVTFAICVAIVVVVIGVFEFFRQTFQAEVQKKQLEWVDPQLREIRAYEEANLKKYQWVNQKDGVVRIPVTRARELVLADYGKMAAYVPGGASPAPALAPAPEGSAAPAASAAPADSAVPAPSASAPTDAPAGSASAPAPTPAPAPSPGAPAPH